MSNYTLLPSAEDLYSFSAPQKIVKRDGRVVDFDSNLIDMAIAKCFMSIGRVPEVPISELVDRVVRVITAKSYGTPTVEFVQDNVERVLLSYGEYEAAKKYILYRAEHEKMREERPVPDEVKAAFAESKKYFPTPLQEFMFLEHYSRFDYNLGRRETWVETVDRAVKFLVEISQNRLESWEYENIRQAILNMQAMPSMRLLAMAGPAARRQNICIYNCSASAIDCLDVFSEALLISMCGCGFGYSVESEFVNKLPIVERQLGLPPVKFIIQDTTEGWVDALKFGIEMWFSGGDVDYDFSFLRPAGSVLKTKGGRASGPDVFMKSLSAIRSRILSRQSSHLRPIDAHDIVCFVASAAISGRRKKKCTSKFI